jgi:hypothetical protein
MCDTLSLHDALPITTLDLRPIPVGIVKPPYPPQCDALI